MIESLYRQCEVILEKETLKGRFHCWEQYSNIIAPSALISGHACGQISQVFGIV